MAFILTEEQQMMVDLARDFARKEIAPVSEKMDREAKFIPGLIEQMAELGLWELMFRKNTAVPVWMK